MCDKAVDDYCFALEFVPGQYKTQEMCEKIISDNSFSLRYVPDQQMCDEAVDDV